MNLHPAVAIAGGLLIGVAAWWWLAREADDARTPGPTPAAAAAAIADADPPGVWLYRWRDANGVLQITDTPPRDRPFERIDREPDPGIRIDGRR